MTTVLELAQQTTVMAVTGRRVGADGVVLLTLTDPAGHDLPGWAPGAHIDLILPDIGLIRHYSLCGSPDNPSEWRIGVLRQPNGRGGSAYVYDALRAGTRVEVRGPRNNFPLVDAERYLFVAGGIGITPILPMIEAATADGRPWELLYGGRSRSSMAFLDELSGYGDRVRVHARDEAGDLSLASVLAEPRPDTLVYCCGPEPLLGAVEDWCAGWPAGALHTERFAARRAAPASGTFDVVCHRAGHTDGAAGPVHPRGRGGGRRHAAVGVPRGCLRDV